MSAKAIAWGLHLNNRHEPEPTLTNIVAVLQKDPQFAGRRIHYDEFKDRLIFTDDTDTEREMRPDDVTRVRLYLQDEIRMTRVTKADVKDAIELVAWQRKRHCVRELVQSVPWDDEPRIDRWLIDYLGAEESESQPLGYLLAAGRNCLLSMLARVLHPGCQVDTMLVLEGPQGIGKTSALRILGGHYYRVALESMTNKDFLQALRGAWLIEIAEMSSTSKADAERIKVIISTPSDPYRPTYGPFTLTYPRQCIFIATTNRDDYLLDDTGGRRFHPVKCGAQAIALSALARDTPQLWAEACTRVQRGEPWHHMPDSTSAIQTHRRVDDAWMATITAYLDGQSSVTISDVLVSALKFRESDITEVHSKRVGRVLRAHGWVRKTLRRGGRAVQGYRPSDSAEE